MKLIELANDNFSKYINNYNAEIFTYLKQVTDADEYGATSSCLQESTHPVVVLPFDIDITIEGFRSLVNIVKEHAPELVIKEYPPSGLFTKRALRDLS